MYLISKLNIGSATLRCRYCFWWIKDRRIVQKGITVHHFPTFQWLHQTSSPCPSKEHCFASFVMPPSWEQNTWVRRIYPLDLLHNSMSVLESSINNLSTTVRALLALALGTCPIQVMIPAVMTHARTPRPVTSLLSWADAPSTFVETHNARP